MPDVLPTSAAPVWTTPSGGAWTYTFTGQAQRTAPVITGDGHVLVPLTQKANPPYDYKVYGVIYSFDLTTSKVIWNASVGTGVYATPCLAEGVLYCGSDDSNLYAIDAATGAQLWSYATGHAIHTEPVYVVSGTTRILLFGTVDGTFYALDVDTQELVWSQPSWLAGSGKTAVIPKPAVAEEHVIFSASTEGAGSSHVYMFRIADGAIQWNVTLASAVRTTGTVVENAFIVGCDDGVSALYTGNGAVVWHEPTSKPVSGAPASDGTHVYYGTSDGSFFARMPQNGELAWMVPVSRAIESDIAVYQGEAYFGAISASGIGGLYILDLASADAQSAKVLIDGVQGHVNVNTNVTEGMFTFIVAGPTTETAYAIEVELTDMINRVQFSSRMVPDDYSTMGHAPVPLAAAFQMTVSVIDPYMSPMSNVPVQIWAGAEIQNNPTVDVTINGQVCALPYSDKNAPTVIADGNGQLAVVAKGDLGMPSLFIRPIADFFLPTFALHVFPDQANLDTLSTMQGSDLETQSSDPAKKDAVGYDGNPVLKDAYANDKSRDSIATSIRNTVGRQANVSKQQLKSSTAFTDVSRNIASGEIESWTVTIDDSAYTFTQGVGEDFETRFAAVGGVFGDFKDFVNKVVKGAEKVAKTEWQYAKDVATVIVQTAEGAYKFVVDSVERALDVVRALIKDVVTAIETFIEWLSWLFDWQTYVDAAKDITKRVNDSIDTLVGWIDEQLARDPQAVLNDLSTVWGGALASFDESVASMGDSTVGSTQQGAGSTSSLMQPNGVDISIQSGWVMKKVRNAIEDILFDPETAQEFVDNTYAHFRSVATILADEAEVFVKELEKALESFSVLFTDPQKFLSTAMATVAGIGRDLVELFYDLLQKLLFDSMRYLSTAFKQVKSIINHKIEIPLISDLWKLVAGTDLTALNVTSLMLAIPAVLINDARKALQTASTAKLRTSDEHIFDFANAVLYIGLAAVWTTQSVVKETPIVVGVAAAVANAASAALGADAEIHDKQWSDWFFWGVQSLQTIPTLFDALVQDPVNAEKADWWKRESDGIFGLFGVVYFIMACIYADHDPEDYKDPDESRLFLNIFDATPLFSPFIKNVAGEKAAILNTAIGYGTSAVIGGVLAWEGLGVNAAASTRRAR